jgi:hypothetical protein
MVSYVVHVVRTHDFAIWVIERWRCGYGVCDGTAVA